MHLINKVKAVNKVFIQLETHVYTFKGKSKLSCVPNCGACCSKPDIETTILEFLPAAYYLYQSKTYDNILNAIENNPDNVCVFFTPFFKDGFCSNYQNRGLVCRLFGYSSRAEKLGNLSLVTCKPIKNSIDTETIQNTVKYAPEMYSYYLKLFGIDPKLAFQYFPINQSIKKALEIILLHSQYTKKPA